MTQPTTTYLKDYRVPDFLCASVALEFELREEHTEVRARLHFQRNPKGQPNAALVLDGEQLSLQSIHLDGQALSEGDWQLNEQQLVIAAVPEDFILETVVHIDPYNNKTLSGLYQSNGNYCTQCESQGFRRITYFLDRPDVLSHYTTCITADEARYPHLLSNGDCVETKRLADGRHWVKWVDPSLKPCYLFALVAGDFETREGDFQTQSGRPVKLHFFVEKGFANQVGHALHALKLAMAWDERVYGREYDLNCYMVVAVSDFNFGAMENKGLNIFNTKYVLADADTATDEDHQNVLAVIGHEYFHNWSGNRVTCRDWFQISLKEGLTVYREHAFVADHTSRGVKRIADAALICNQQFAEDRGPMSHPVRPDHYIEINNFYTLTVYHKGAELIRMLALLLGPQVYRQATDLYFSRHDGQAVTTEDFVVAMEEASGLSLQQFRSWYDVAGTPHLQAHGVYDADQQSYTLTFRQSIPGHQDVAMHIPVLMGLLSDTGAELGLYLTPEGGACVQEHLLHVTEAAQSVVFYRVPSAPIPSLLRGFSAPVALSVDLSEDALHVMWLHDVDPYKRWEAGVKLAVNAILSYGSDAFAPKVDRLVGAFAHLLAEVHDDLAFQTHLLTLPTETYVLQQKLPCDLDQVLAGYAALKASLAERLHDQWLSQYHAHMVHEGYALDWVSVNRRAFKNLCLSYLAVTPDAETLALCEQQYMTADNLTDRMGALNAVRDHDSDERTRLLDDFYKQGDGQPLVRDRWFQLQAASRASGGVERVRALLKHPDFHWQNPNRVRSLLSTFAQSNLLAFHDASGEGYALVGEAVMTLDAMNPQTAARLMEPFTRWRQYDRARSGRMQALLKRMLLEPSLSKGVYEVASRSLEF